MSIIDINIKNFKCLKDINIYIGDKYELSCFLGKNGTGKSNILNAIKYFYDNMFSYYGHSRAIDNRNIYIQNMEISITYDFSNLLSNKTLSIHLQDSINNLEPYFNDEKQMLVKMTQYKDGRLKWYPEDKKVLTSISNIFPMYHIDTRDIDLVNWEVLWNIISDISKRSSNISDEEYHEMLDQTFVKAFEGKYEKSLDIIKEVLEAENIKLDQHNYIDRYKNILTVRFGGSEFLSEGNKLDYYSDGLNSFRFLTILLKIIPKLTRTAWKEPIILIDEPEIGLHSSYIYEIVETIKENIDKSVNLFITTHSSDLICELMKNEINTNIYRTYIVDHYTLIEKMDGNIDENERHRLTINEARCYFANAIVAVEGVSDIQVFSNSKIRELFPKLRKIEFYSMNSNNVGFNFISPIKRNISIPSLLIVDMDKIIAPIGNKHKQPMRYRINRDSRMNPLSNKETKRKEKLLYDSLDNKKINRHDRREFIKKTLKSYRFQIKDPGFYMEDPIYSKLIANIQVYCLEYQTFPFRTTIEGALINLSNYKEVLNWLKKEKNINIDKLDEVLEIHEEDDRYKTTILRLISSGKYDSLHKPDKLDVNIKGEIMYLENNFGKKTSGWIDSWINFYFDRNIDNIEDVEEKRKMFEKHFPELTFVLYRIEKLI